MGTVRFLIIGSYAPSLVGFRKELISTLQTKKIEVHVAAPELSAKSVVRKKLEFHGVNVHNLTMQRAGQNPLGDLLCFIALWILMFRVRPHYVLTYTIKPVIYGSIAALLAGVKKRIAMVEGLGFVFTTDSAKLSVKRQLLKCLVHRLYRLGLGAATKAIFLNPDDQREFLQLELVSQHKTFILGGIGVNFAEWPLSEAVSDPITFLCVARLLREKGIEEFAYAAKEVKQQYSNSRFIVLGGLDDNPGAIPIESMNRWVKEGTLEWHGHVPVQPWMRQASVFVLPSYREGVPVSTQEAMAMGRAVITTDVPGCRETVEHNENGFLVPVRNVNALKQAMLRFIEEPDLIVRMGQRSRVIAELKYDVHKVNAILLQEIGIQ